MSSAPQSWEIAQTGYFTAYDTLPRYVFTQPQKVVRELAMGRIGAMFFYTMTSLHLGREPEDDAMDQLAAHVGNLDETRRYFILQYPAPPPIDFDNTDFEVQSDDDLDDITPDIGTVVVSPYFSAMVADAESGAVGYFILGRTYDGTTTFRTVTPEINANLGPGCAPELEAFVQLLKQRSHPGEIEEPVACSVRGSAQKSEAPPMPPAEAPAARKKWWQFGR